MPLNKACSLKAYNQNVAELVRAGHPAKEAAAIAAQALRKACGAKRAAKLLAAKTVALAARTESPGPIPQEAIDYLEAKGIFPAWDSAEVWREEHDTMFTVASLMLRSVLADVQESLTAALKEGQTFRDWQKGIRKELVRSGWGRTVDETQRPFRLYTIYQTNLRVARAVGQWQRIERTKRTHPYLEYFLGPSERHRAEHAAIAGTIRSVEDPFWDSYSPPNGYGCKCGVRQLSRREADARGGETELPDTSPVEHINKRTGERVVAPKGIDPGWDHNPGKARKQVLDMELEKQQGV